MAESNHSETAQDPSKSEMELLNARILNDFIDKRITMVREDSIFEGECRSMDGYLNTVLENATFKNKENGASMSLKTCFVIGNSVKHISILK
ncbi:uncharacterized protein VICG_01874 [Vittaforma corneae ATCC 50505]|uniref:Sm domain-containing protein n=1 Tax=Vittaforma corneae (strain ATCC 50505) TaxID=993615 RepID=L2GJQ9_VITCO|nr:uncharacterized protein VICG_01874 [Vittaforma corneae ATCC 50505]ELA41081.1 hypothetical protein VICG_01874 [Vittaforma corneae ATCC 50505]